ncbi:MULTISPECIES: hypothetical protein [unclassified Nocardia]|uniref:hypothetical protein n=1 Tax=unclassified Nocardia TaxID=2637762 RepID=UPI001CE45237|nr:MULTISPECIES: hypothetical protein [unclassified Nocardia]
MTARGEQPDQELWSDETISATEQLDEDELGVDPLEAGMDPPDEWSGADRYAVPPADQRAGPSLGDRLAEEEPDIEPGQPD